MLNLMFLFVTRLSCLSVEQISREVSAEARQPVGRQQNVGK